MLVEAEMLDVRRAANVSIALRFRPEKLTQTLDASEKRAESDYREPFSSGSTAPLGSWGCVLGEQPSLTIQPTFFVDSRIRSIAAHQPCARAIG